eukprot:COSAG05_NODE_4231_length_1612_cov_3.775281_2_plen_74_part_00
MAFALPNTILYYIDGPGDSSLSMVPLPNEVTIRRVKAYHCFDPSGDCNFSPFVTVNISIMNEFLFDKRALELQ